MKKASILGLAILWLASISAYSQSKGPRLIIRGDDMGYSHSGNEAIMKAYREGIETSVEVIVPSPWFPEAVQQLQDNPRLDVGIHLVLTSEWDNVKWRPLTDCPSLKDADGYFYPMLSPNPNYPGRSVSENKYRLADIEKEWRAQIELALRKIPRISHISGHMGCTNLSDSVKALATRLTKEYKIDIDLSELGVQSMGYAGPSRTPEEKLRSFLAMLEKLEPGKTYLFVDHPGLDTPELRAVSHIGYEHVAADRQGVTDLWTNARVKEAIRKKGIQLVSYKDLKKS